jgi:hypothetical protein
MSARTVALVALLVGVTLAGVGPALADETASIDEDSLPLDAGPQQVIVGQTSLAQGSELTVRLQSSEPVPYLRQSTAYVGRNGTFAVVFDMDTAEANSSFDLTVLHDGTTLLERNGTVATCEGNCTDTVPDIPGTPDTVVTVERGAVATVPVSTDDNDSARFSLGDPAGSYLVNATLSDGNGDGEVRVRVDTAVPDPNEATLSVVDAADSITLTREEPTRTAPVETGDYDFRVSSDGATVETGLLVVEANESAEYEVDDADSTFERSIYTARQGNIAAIAVTLGDADTATLSLGGPENGYQINATLSDGDGDDTVTVLFDTAAAGRSGETLQAAGGDTVTPVEGSEVERDTYIDAGDYDLALYQGSAVTDNPADVATLSVDDGNVSTSTETPLAVTAERTTDATGGDPPNVGLGAIALGGLLALGGVGLVFRTLLS